MPVDPFATIPSGQTFPLRLAPGFFDSVAAGEGSGGKKRKREERSIVGLRYNFKPGSITSDTPGAIHTDRGARSLRFDLPSGGQQVFDAREEEGKARDCVMIWDEVDQTFTLHPLASTLHLTLNRTASSTSGPAPLPGGAGLALPSAPSASSSSTGHRTESVASSSSSSAVPLANSLAASSSRKRSRPSIVEPTPTVPPSRAAKAGKSVPRKQPVLPPIATPPATKGRGKAGARKKPPAPPSKAKTPTRSEPRGKIKSAAMIEDSDEEAAAYDETAAAGAGLGMGEVEEEEDEFAQLLGESLARDESEPPEVSSEEEEEEEDDDDEALGGARVVLPH